MSNVQRHDHKKMSVVMLWVILFMFVQLSNESIIQLLAPVMVEYYGVTMVKISIIVTIGGIVFGVGGTIYSVLTEVLSMRQLFLFGIITFCIGSLIGFIVHPWFALFAVARFIQCMGAVCATGCYIVLVSRYLPEKVQSTYLAVSTALFLLGAGLGVLAGSFITNYLSWEFALLLPFVTALAIPVIYKHMPNDRPGKGKLDIPGAVIVSIGVIFSILAISLQNYYCLFGAILFLAGYVMYARRRQNPFLELKLLSIKGLKLTYVTTFLLFGVQYCVLFLLPFIVREMYGLTLLQTGWLFLAANSPALATAMITGKVVSKIGRNRTFYLGWSLFFTSLVLFTICMGAPLYFIWLAMFLFAISNPFLYTGIVTAASGLLPDAKLGSGMGIFLLMMGWGNSVVVSVMGLLLTNRLIDFRIFPYISNGADASSYSNAYLILAIIFFIVFLLYRYVHGNKVYKHEQ